MARLSNPFSFSLSMPTRRKCLKDDVQMNRFFTHTIHQQHIHIRPRSPSSISVTFDPNIDVGSRSKQIHIEPASDEDEAQRAIEQFISTIQSSLQDETFISFTLKGPSVPRRRKNSSTSADKEQLAQQKEKLRGKYKLITGRLVLLKDNKKKKKESGLYLQANIKYHLATDVAQNWRVGGKSHSDNSEVEVGLRNLFSTAMGKGDNGNDASNLISEWGAPSNNQGLGLFGGELSTTQGIYKLTLVPTNKAGFFKTKQKIHVSNGGSITKASVDLSHDKQKNVPLSPSSLFLQKLGVTNADGKPVNGGMSSKLKQCQKFVEIVGNLVDNYVTTSSSNQTTARVTDMGCGRGYLTFSLHSYLTTKYLSVENARISSVSTQGIDRRPKLIQEINGIARDLGGHFNSLAFIEGTIGSTEDNLLQKGTRPDPESPSLDILIALHACDTATDDAIWYGITRDADIIVTAPCCQHELRSQIDRHASMLSKQRNCPLNEILRHAIYRERHTEIVTDTMRAQLLEIAGYDTQVFEFIGGEHTAKNVMITAVKRGDQSDKDNHLEDKRRKFVELANMYGIKRQRLATLMGESINVNDVNDVMTSSGMPPL